MAVPCDDDDAPAHPFPAQNEDSWDARPEDEAQEDRRVSNTNKKMMACIFAGGYYY